MAELVLLAELKRALKDTTTTNDTMYTEAIEDASQAVRDWCDREFVSPVTTSATRRYAYDGSGVLHIDDAKTITAVSLVTAAATTVLEDTDWEAGPYRATGTRPYWFLDLIPRVMQSPEMGFARNLDKLWPKYLYQGGSSEAWVDVTAIWGWDAFPKSVRRAALWTAVAFTENPRQVISEHVEGVSRSYANPGRTQAIPQRAKDLLEPYSRWR